MSRPHASGAESRRERWIWARSMDEGYNDIHKTKPTGEWEDEQDYVHFVELFPGERIVSERPPASTATSRDELAHAHATDYFINEDDSFGEYRTDEGQEDAFKAGWDARDEEVRQLRETLEKIALILAPRG